MSPYRVAILAAFAVSSLVSGACDMRGRRGRPAVTQGSATKVDSCAGRRIRVTRAPVTMSETDRCSLIIAALGLLSRGSAFDTSWGAVDTSKITAVSIDEWRFRNLVDKPGEPYWTLQFQANDRAHEIVVYRKSDGSMHVRRGQG